MSIHSTRLFDGGIRLRAIAFTMLVALAATVIGGAVQAAETGLPRACAEATISMTGPAAIA